MPRSSLNTGCAHALHSTMLPLRYRSKFVAGESAALCLTLSRMSLDRQESEAAHAYVARRRLRAVSRDVSVPVRVDVHGAGVVVCAHDRFDRILDRVELLLGVPRQALAVLLHLAAHRRWTAQPRCRPAH